MATLLVEDDVPVVNTLRQCDIKEVSNLLKISFDTEDLTLAVHTPDDELNAYWLYAATEGAKCPFSVTVTIGDQIVGVGLVEHNIEKLKLIDYSSMDPITDLLLVLRREFRSQMMKTDPSAYELGQFLRIGYLSVHPSFFKRGIGDQILSGIMSRIKAWNAAIADGQTSVRSSSSDCSEKLLLVEQNTAQESTQGTTAKVEADTVYKYVYVETSVPGSQRICEKFGFQEWYRLIYTEFCPAYNTNRVLHDVPLPLPLPHESCNTGSSQSRFLHELAEAAASSPIDHEVKAVGTVGTDNDHPMGGCGFDMTKIKSPHCLLQVLNLDTQL